MSAPGKTPEGSKKGLVDLSQCGPGIIGVLTTTILDECLQNIIHDIVLEVHSEEKIARAHSATIVVEEEARRLDNAKLLASTGDSAADQDKPTRFENEAAIYDDGQVYLKGNPLATTKDIICTRCRLPRLLHPPSGNGGVPPDANRQFCARHPSIDKPGHDIWGSPFATDPVTGSKAKKEKKNKEAASERGSVAGSPTAASVETKPAVTFPSVKCPVCNRYFCVTRFTPHLEKCMAVNVRDASRKAKAKIELSNSRNSSTPHGSRRGTPIPGSQPASNKRSPPDDDDDDEDETPKKKKKKIVKKPVEKEKDQTPKAKKLKDLPTAAKPSPNPSKPSPSPKPTPQPDRKVSKPRIFDSEDDSDVPVAPKKKTKLPPDDGPASKPIKVKATSTEPKATNGIGTKKQTPDLAAPRDATTLKERPQQSSPISKPKPSPEKNGSVGAAATKKRKLEDHQQNGDGDSGKGDNDPFHKRTKKQHTDAPSVPAVEV